MHEIPNINCVYAHSRVKLYWLIQLTARVTLLVKREQFFNSSDRKTQFLKDSAWLRKHANIYWINFNREIENKKNAINFQNVCSSIKIENRKGNTTNNSNFFLRTSYTAKSMCKRNFRSYIESQRRNQGKATDNHNCRSTCNNL